MKRSASIPALFILFVVFGLTLPLFAETVRLPVVRDLWISSASGEEEGNNGGTPKLKLKGYQEFSLVDFDVSQLKGKKIVKATLHVKLASDERLYRVGVSTITAPWNEGSGSGYEKIEGASSFRWRAYPDHPWIDCHETTFSTEYSDITSVIFGEGGSIWRNSDATDPVDGWQTIDVAPEIVVARFTGLSEGFVLFDDTGTEVVQEGDNTLIRLFPNRFIYSHDQNRASEPYLEVEFEEPSEELSKSTPSAPENVRFDQRRLPRGSVKFAWSQKNCLKSRIIGFHVSIDGAPVCQSFVPAVSFGSSETQFFETRIDGLDASSKHTMKVSSVDILGRESQSCSISFKPSSYTFSDWENIVERRSGTSASAGQKKAPLDNVVNLGATKVFIVQQFDKILENGELLPSEEGNYFASNPIWDAASRTIDLAAAKNEFIGFQIAFEGAPQKIRFELDWDGRPNELTAAFYRFARVASSKGNVADPAILLESDSLETPIRKGNDVVLCELFVPEDARHGLTKGKLRIIDEKGRTLSLNLRLKIWNFALPNELTFLPEMNCYSLPENEVEYYRLAQLHRTYINRVPYSHRGSVGDGLAPKWNASELSFDWKAWEERFGQYFDGSAFADLPRGPVPIEAFYLPLFENFPGDIFKGFAGDFTWPDSSAFTDEYQRALRSGCRSFSEKIVSEGWSKTRFLFFLNNKNDYKKNGWYNASSPWLLDEPASFRDFAALEFFGKILKESVSDKESFKDAILYRADISRPQWERDSLQSLLDVYVVGGGPFKAYNKMVRDRSEGRNKRLVYTYGTTSLPSESAYQPIFWSLDAWSLGADGIVPWQTIGNQESWHKEDELSLFYPPTEESAGKVAPSIRLKAYRSGEQLIEYLSILVKKTGRPRDEVARALRYRLRLDQSTSVSRNAEDAGTNYYDSTTPVELERIRRDIGEYIDRLAQ